MESFTITVFKHGIPCVECCYLLYCSSNQPWKVFNFPIELFEREKNISAIFWLLKCSKFLLRIEFTQLLHVYDIAESTAQSFCGKHQPIFQMFYDHVLLRLSDESKFFLNKTILTLFMMPPFNKGDKKTNFFFVAFSGMSIAYEKKGRKYSPDLLFRHAICMPFIHFPFTHANIFFFSLQIATNALNRFLFITMNY